jgi:hypothetical protein
VTRYVLKRPTPWDDDDFHQYWDCLQCAPSDGGKNTFVG